MRYLRLTIIPLTMLLIAGCSSSRSTISASDPYAREEFQERFRNKKARIYTEYGQIINAESMTLTEDTLYYETRRSSYSLAVEEVERIERKGGVPGLMFLGVGTIVTGGVVTGKAFNSSSPEGIGQAFGGLILSGVGVILFVISISSKGRVIYLRK